MPKRKLESRHVHYEDDEVEEMREDLKNGNTKKSNKKCEKIFREYIQERWPDLVEIAETFQFDNNTLDKILCKMWFEVRQQNQDRYTVNSLKNLRYGINRVLKLYGFPHNIVKSEVFAKSQEAFDDACRQLKKLGYGVVKHYDEIKPKGK